MKTSEQLVRKPVTLRAIMELLQSNSVDAGYLDAPLEILVQDGNRNCEFVALENIGWHLVPRVDFGGDNGKVQRLACYLNDHRLVKNRKTA